MPEFNREGYVDHSRKGKFSDMDFGEVARYPLSEDEIRRLAYMMDIEGHMTGYRKPILAQDVHPSSKPLKFPV